MPESGRGRSVRQDQREHRPEIPALAAGPVVELDFQERSGGVIEAHQTEIEGGEPWTLPRRRADDNARDPVHPCWVDKPLRFTIPEASQPRGDSPIGGHDEEVGSEGLRRLPQQDVVGRWPGVRHGIEPERYS